MNENFATKPDVQELKADLKSDIAELRSEFRTEISQVRSELHSEVSQLRSEVHSEFSQGRSELREVEYRMTIKLGGMMTLAIGVTATLVRLLQSVH